MANDNLNKEALHKEAEPITIITTLLISTLAPIIIGEIFKYVMEKVKKGESEESIISGGEQEFVSKAQGAVGDKAKEFDQAAQQQSGGQQGQPTAAQTAAPAAGAAQGMSSINMMKTGSWASLALKALTPLAKPILKWLVEQAKAGVTQITKEMLTRALNDLVKNIISSIFQTAPKAAMDALVGECIKNGAPIGTLKKAYEDGDLVKVAEITAEYSLDPELVKEALPFMDWFKKKKTLSEIREEMRKDEQLVKEISARVKSFKEIYQRYVADLGDEKSAREKFSGEYGNRVPDSIRKIMTSQQTGDPAANLIIGLALSTTLLNPRSVLVTKYYPDIVNIVKKMPGESSDNLKAVIINVLKPLVGANYPTWSKEIRQVTTTKSPSNAPPWYAAVQNGISTIQQEIESGGLSDYVAERMTDELFDSAPSAIGFDVEKALEKFLLERVTEAVSKFPLGSTPSASSEYTYRKDAIRNFKALVSDMVNARTNFSRDLADKLLIALHNRQEEATPEIQKELGSLAKKWDRGLLPALDKAYMSAVSKFNNIVEGYSKSVMTPQSDIAVTDVPKAAERQEVRIVIGKKKLKAVS
jgi:hypothetical protein